MPIPTIRDSTRAYESWLAEVIGAPLVAADLAHKHELMADAADPFPFLRGTYYRWAEHWAESAGALADAPKVLAVGDLHAENFGTWRDAEGRLCWGVNDFDEADELPYTNDLVRLVAGLRIARKASGKGGIAAVKTPGAAEAVLAGYRECLAHGGSPFVLEERHPHLRAISNAGRDPAKFWAELGALPEVAAQLPQGARAALSAALPKGAAGVSFRPRPQAGVGSLGRPRFVALADLAGGRVGREVKASAPAATSPDTPPRAAELVAKALRSPDPDYRPGAQWVARRLAPSAARLGVSKLSEEGALKVLTAMGAETANVHLGTAGAAHAIRVDLEHRPAGWLESAAKAFAALVEADWVAWRAKG